MNCLFFVVALLLFSEVYCDGSGVSVTIDISMFVEDIAKDVKILDYGVANKEVMSLASGIAMPDNITYASFVWWTDEPEEYSEKYEFVIQSVDPTILIGYLDIPMTGYVPKNQQKYSYNLK